MMSARNILTAQGIGGMIELASQSPFLCTCPSRPAWGKVGSQTVAKQSQCSGLGILS